MKLQKMTDFVLYMEEKFMNWEYPFNKDNPNLDYYIIQYANFLKQPLELWMFVPCDENGNVLEEPNRSTHTNIKCEQYQQAKERCLFEGCKARKIEDYYLISNENYTFWASWNDSFNIEHIIKHNLELTPTAIKQIQ